MTTPTILSFAVTATSIRLLVTTPTGETELHTEVGTGTLVGVSRRIIRGGDYLVKIKGEGPPLAAKTSLPWRVSSSARSTVANWPVSTTRHRSAFNRIARSAGFMAVSVMRASKATSLNEFSAAAMPCPEKSLTQKRTTPGSGQIMLQ